MFLRHKYLFDNVTDENAGIAIKAILDYFDTGEIVDDIPDAPRMILFAIKPDIDECFDLYTERCENGKLGGRPRKETKNHYEPYGFSDNHMVSIETGCNHDEPCETEEEARSEKVEDRRKKAEKEVRCGGGVKWFAQQTESEDYVKGGLSAPLSDNDREYAFSEKKRLAMSALRESCGEDAFRL